MRTLRLAMAQINCTVGDLDGNLKKIITRFSRRGLQAATAEIDLAATAYNLLKIHRAAAAPA